MGTTSKELGPPAGRPCGETRNRPANAAGLDAERHGDRMLWGRRIAEKEQQSLWRVHWVVADEGADRGLR